MEPKELSPALLQPPVTVVAILGELLATLPRLDEEMRLFKFPGCLYWDLDDFTRELQNTLYRADDFWRRRNVTCNDNDPPSSLSQALAAYKSTPGTTWDRVTMAASMWQWSVSVLGNSWVQLARTASKLRYTCRDLATKAADMVATARARELQDLATKAADMVATARARELQDEVAQAADMVATARASELQDEVAHDGTALENMGELGQALGGEEGVARTESQVSEEAKVATCKATMATMVGQQLEEPLGLLERLVAACTEAIVFPRQLWRLLEDTETTLKGTNEASRDVPKVALVALVAVGEATTPPRPGVTCWGHSRTSAAP